MTDIFQEYPISLRAFKCANPDTVEWSLVVDGQAVKTAWLSSKSPQEAIAHLLGMHRPDLQCEECGWRPENQHAIWCSSRRALV